MSAEKVRARNRVTVTTRVYFHAENQLFNSPQRERTPSLRGFWLYSVNLCKWQPFCRILLAQHFIGSYLSENRHFATVTLPSPLSTELRAWGRFQVQVQVSVGARRLITTKMPGYVLRLPEGLQFSLFLFETHYFGPTCPSWPVVTVIRCQSRWIPQFDSPESVCALNASGQ